MPVLMTKNLSPGRLGHTAEPGEIVGLAHYYGFESIDPDAGFLGGLNDDELTAYRDYMTSRNVAWAAAGVPVDFRNDDATYQAGMEGLPAFAASLERAGVARAGTWLMPGSNELNYDANTERHVTRLREIARVLGDHNLRFGLEYVATHSLVTSFTHPWVHSLAEAKRLVSEIGEPNVGYILDTWHWYHADETADDIRSLANEDVVAVDLNDAPKDLPKSEMQDNAREVPCSTGVIDTANFMRALQAIGYDGPVRAEPFNRRIAAMPRDEAFSIIAHSLHQAWEFLDA